MLHYDELYNNVSTFQEEDQANLRQQLPRILFMAHKELTRLESLGAYNLTCDNFPCAFNSELKQEGNSPPALGLLYHLHKKHLTKTNAPFLNTLTIEQLEAIKAAFNIANDIIIMRKATFELADGETKKKADDIIKEAHNPTSPLAKFKELRIEQQNKWSARIGIYNPQWKSATFFSGIRKTAKADIESEIKNRIPNKMDWLRANLKATLTVMVRRFNAYKPSDIKGIPAINEQSLEAIIDGITQHPYTKPDSQSTSIFIDDAATNPKVKYIVKHIVDKDRKLADSEKNQQMLRPATTVKNYITRCHTDYHQYCKPKLTLSDSAKVPEIDKYIQELVESKKVYISILEAYAKDLDTLKPANAQYTKEQLSSHIIECKFKLYALEAMCSRDDRVAMAIAKRTWLMLPGALIAAGGALYSSIVQDQINDFAIQALQDIGHGSFDKLWKGLADGNPVLWITVLGYFLGAAGLITGLIEGAEIASQYNNRHKAIEYFELLIGNQADKLQLEQMHGSAHDKN